MRRLATPVLALGLALSAVAAAPAQDQRAEADHVVELTVGESTTVQGGVPQGVNVSPFVSGQGGGELVCSDAPNEYCETILVHLTNPYEEENAKKGRERASANFVLTTPSNQGSDYDVYWYESDEDGTKGAEIASSTAFPYGADSTESASIVTTTTADDEDMWVLVEVIYFSAIEAYTMDIDYAG